MARAAEPIPLLGLRGDNPLDVLAAWGVIAALSEPIRNKPTKAKLWWGPHEDRAGSQIDLSPVAWVQGPRNMQELVSRLNDDRYAWEHSPVLDVDNVTLSYPAALAWATKVQDATAAELRLWRSLINLDPLLIRSGGMVAHTRFRFTSGQMKFIRQVRDLRAATTLEHLESALTIGTERSPALPGLRWDLRDDQEGWPSLDAAAPRPVAKEWLAWRGLTVTPPVEEHNRWRSVRAPFLWPVNEKRMQLSELRAVVATRDVNTDPAEPSIVLRPDALTEHRYLGCSYVEYSEHGYGVFKPGSIADTLDGEHGTPFLRELRRREDLGNFLGAEEIAQKVGITPEAWRGYVAEGRAPLPTAHYQNEPMWSLVHMSRWELESAGQVWGDDDPPLYGGKHLLVDEDRDGVPVPGWPAVASEGIRSLAHVIGRGEAIPAIAQQGYNARGES